LKKSVCHKIFFLLCLALLAGSVHAQNPGNILKGIGNKIPGMGGSQGGAPGGGGNDSVRTRNPFADSITVNVFYLDQSRPSKLDSSISDFTKHYPIPATHMYLGNTGVATKSIIFDPNLRAGWDPGFHALDVYKWKLQDVRFFNVTRPYSELAYVLASGAEQQIEVFHTQNIKPNWNFSFNYRLINAPGLIRNLRTNHNNYAFTNWFQSKSKRYNNYLILLGNKLQTGENGGIKNDHDYLHDPTYEKSRLTIPTKIGGDPDFQADFFSNSLVTGNRYYEFNFLMRQQLDFGRKDSIVTDSTVTPLFFPSVRFEHTFNFGTYKYSFQDFFSTDQKHYNTPDSMYYANFYKFAVPNNDSILLRDNWKEVSNDFSIYQFPDSKNQYQFIKVGAQLQLLHGDFFRIDHLLPSESFHNVILHGEYRNRTKNQRWDILAFGRLYATGYNVGDYQAYASIESILGQGAGTIRLGFENVNRSPSFIFNQRSGFYLDAPKVFNKENTTHLFGSVFIQKLRTQLSANYYLLGNYLYLNGYRELQQESTVFNVLTVSALKTFVVGKRWNWYAEVYLQQKTGGAQLHLPFLYTRNRFMYEGNLGFRKLNVAMGIEARYTVPYKVDNYSPALGQFFYQDSVTISNFPDIHAFLHFRIRSFKAFIRAENLNTASFKGGFQFDRNNLAAPDYPIPGLILRFGIFWGFVN
jgi:hypothetical protein